jgi:hypothetical protein
MMSDAVRLGADGAGPMNVLASVSSRSSLLVAVSIMLTAPNTSIT